MSEDGGLFGGIEMRKRDLAKSGIAVLGTTMLAGEAGGQKSSDPDVAVDGPMETCVLQGVAEDRKEVDPDETCALIYKAPVAGETYYSPLGIEGWHLPGDLVVANGRLRLAEGATIVDSFEDGDLAEYTVIGNDIFGVDTTSPIEGSGSLEIANESNVSGFYEDLIYADANSLDSGNVPQKGDIFSCLVYEPDKSTGTNPNFGWGGDSSGVTGYTFLFTPTVPEVTLRRVDGAGNVTKLASDGDSAYGVEQEAFEVEVEWHDGTGSESDNTIVARLYDLDSNLDRIQQVGSDIKATDSTYSSQTEVFFAGASSNLENGLYADRYRITGEV